MKNYFLTFLAAFMVLCTTLLAQDRKDKTPVTYEEIYDEPYSVNKLFVGFQPLYGELFVTNVNAGFGVEASYYHQDKVDFRAHFRKTYSRHFFDFSRDLAINNSDVDNAPQVFNYFEIGGTYHVKDFEASSKTKMFLYKNSYKGNKWAARVPLNADVPCKVRKIYGVRLGGIIWDSSTDLSRAMAKQGLTNADLKDSEGNGLPLTFNDGVREQPVDVFTNIAAKGLYVGGSMSWIKNVAVNFDKFEEGIDDLMFTAYFDILLSPSIKIDDVVYTDNTPSSPNAGTRTYDISPIKTKTFGFRAGIDGRFNRTWSWSYGGEVGFRPSLEGRTFYALIKIAFPVYGTNLDYKVEAFGK
ncbi:MAG: hypothetical protein ACOYXT_26525 [Bacteroidota bacterium]